MLRIAIVEDEQAYACQLEQYLRQFEKEKNERIELTIFRDGDEIAESYRCEYDLILMDVQMPYMDGMTAAREIRKVDPDVVIIFITNMAQFAINGYEVDALDYVLKPISYFGFAQRINRAIERMKKRSSPCLILSSRAGSRKINIDSIYYVESQGHNMIYHTDGGQFTSIGTMKELQEKLEPLHFCRGNSGYLVNLKYVDGVEDGFAVVHGEKLQLSRSRCNEFMTALTDYMGEVIK